MAHITLAATGDSIITRRVSNRTDADFVELTELIRSADVAFTNLEIMTPREPWVPSSEYGGMHLGARPFVLDELQWFGFNLYNVANNHATDYTFQGLLDTLEQLEARGMVSAGGGRNMGEARSPAYLEIPQGRVALIAAASSYVTGALAAENRTDVGGRPGISPLRFKKHHVLDRASMQALKQIDEALGTAEVVRRRREFGILAESEDQAHEYRFVEVEGPIFVEGEATGVRTYADERDVEDISRWIVDARRQADLVVVSLHAHEGQRGDSNSDTPADFIMDAARRWIDAGADIFIGHGPHMLRGMEIYKGKPIFYSIGNFMFMFETVMRLPAEMYERHNLGHEATPADVYDIWSQRPDGEPGGFHADPRFWHSVVPMCRFEGGKLAHIDLHPVMLTLDGPRASRGVPSLADAERGVAILEELKQLSAPFGTEMKVETRDGRAVGVVKG